MSDDVVAETTLLRRESSTTYKVVFRVIKDHDKKHHDHLCLKKNDIVIVETDQFQEGSPLRFGYKVADTHQNKRGWFHPSCLMPCDIPIENLKGPRYLLSTTPLESTINLLRTSITSSITSCSSSSSSVETSSNKKSKHQPEVFWMVFNRDGDKTQWRANGHRYPVNIDWESHIPQKQGDGNVRLCLSTYAPVDPSWHDVFKAFSNHMIYSMGLVVTPTAGSILNGIADMTYENTTSLSLNGKKICGYLYKANSTKEFGKEMVTHGHISEKAYRTTFGKVAGDKGKGYCLYNCHVNQFVFLGYKFNCNWMSIKDKHLSTGLSAKLLKEGINIDNPE